MSDVRIRVGYRTYRLRRGLITAALRVLRDPRNSKAAKVAAGQALTQRR